MEYSIEVNGGKSVRLKTAGKYCDRDIVVTAKNVGAGAETIKNQDKEITKNGVYSADAGYTGLGTVTVEVNPNLEEGRAVTPSRYTQIVEPIQSYDGLKDVTVYGDNNLVPENIAKDVYIFGVKGEHKPSVSLQPTVNVMPSNVEQTVIYDSKYDGLSKVVVQTDENLKPENIKKNTTIFGVVGEYEASANLTNISITPQKTTQIFYANDTPGVDGYYYVLVRGDNDLIPQNIKDGVDIFGVTGTLKNNYASLVDKSITKITADQLEGVKKIGDLAFCYCYDLKEVHLPSTALYFGAETFRGCGSIQTMSIPAGWGYYEGDEGIFFGYLFGAGDSYGQADIVPKTLNTVNIIEGRDFIADTAFQKCSNIKNITMAEGVKTIGVCAFGETGISSIEIPSSVINIKQNAFDRCQNLSTVSFSPNSNLSIIGSSAFYGCSSLGSFEIPSGVVEIGNTAFSNSNLPQISFGENSQLETIGSGAFYGCKFSSIQLPSTGKLKTIGDGAFQNCTNITSIEIPSGVTTIEDYAFKGCSNLKEIRMRSTTPPTLGGSSVFSNTQLEKITVPSGAKRYYVAQDYWRNYANIMLEE